MITCVSCNYGNYDSPKPPPPGADRYVYFTDGEAPPGWVKSPVNPPACLPPRYRSKGPKAMPQAYGIVGDVVWIDASLRSTGKDVRELVALVPDGGVGTFKHRRRTSLMDEAAVSATLKRYAREPVIAQAEHYANVAPSSLGVLYETGCVVWRGAQLSLGMFWLAEMLAWSSQDQISLPYVAALYYEFVTVLPGTSVENDWFVWVQHSKVDW